MSTVEEFEAAPAGATARSPYNAVVKTGLSTAPWVCEVRYPGGIRIMERLASEHLVERGYVLDPSPAVPTSAQEALDLAWELAHPAPVGRIIPAGAPYLYRVTDDQVVVVVSAGDFFVSEEAVECRTIDPDPEPDWLDAPAVLAATILEDRSEHRSVFVRENKAGTQWVRDTRVYRWDELIDVVPLYPKGHDA